RLDSPGHEVRAGTLHVPGLQDSHEDAPGGLEWAGIFLMTLPGLRARPVCRLSLEEGKVVKDSNSTSLKGVSVKKTVYILVGLALFSAWVFSIGAVVSP